jgi:hypothetical protein
MWEGIGQIGRLFHRYWPSALCVVLGLALASAAFADTRGDAQAKREQLMTQRAEAWKLYYAEKYEDALKAAERLEKSAAGDKDQRAAQLEATHIIARCYWSGGDNKASRAEAQRRWKELEKADDYLANAARAKIAKALMLEDPKKPAQTAQAVATLEELCAKPPPASQPGKP